MFLVPSSSRAVDPYLQTLLLRVSLSRLGGKHRHCELLYQLRKKLKVVAHRIAEVPVQGGTIYGMVIPEGYASVMVDRVEKGWEDLDLEIPGGDGEEELGQTPSTLGSVGRNST